ncbi:PVC-type heme-binding CxxCH protein [Adhaeribacter rhizoryzae]|uniref:Dehydrogenase n=2 Tax=Adhaeribacter rhizoryzae TaxID=2607907 RepID=A0A5M6D2I3_9BACT|nr:dehydrogenase [Adhaeribacter rhizoryzae]
MRKTLLLLLLLSSIFYGCTNKASKSGGGVSQQKSDGTKGRRAEILFLGHTSKHHDSGKYAPWLATSLFNSGINITYTVNLQDLNTENLAKYDGLIIYANHDNLAPDQEKALQAFVEGGKGLIPLHSASGCFKNSDWYIQTIGGQFKSHGTGKFTATIAKKYHPVTEGLNQFSTWDETYVHQNLNKDMTVLMERTEGNTTEPYTWVRNLGKGRVFYTAYGHNDSTWTNPGFLNLVKNGVMWAVGKDVQAQIARLNLPAVDIYKAANINISNFTKRYEVPSIQPALTPEQSQKLIQVPVNFELKLFAAEPDIINPISMAWDERGRLWVVESVDYPNTFKETDGVANDRIKICEDTDGDGKADKFTVFADKLNIPTSLVFSNGGVIVSMAPNFVFMKDTNGDDKADVFQNIMSGWGKNDTHAGPSNLQYGFDNKIWGVVGYAGFNSTVDGKAYRFGNGVYKFNPDGKGFEFLGNTSNNTWGLGFSEDNNVFISTANNTHSAYYGMPARLAQRSLPALPALTAQNTTGGNRPASQNSVQPVQKLDGHYEVHAMTPNLRQVDVLGGFTAAAGHHLYTARNFPKEYWNRIAFVTEPTVRLTHNAIIEPDGAGFTEKDGWNLLASSDEWFGPVHAEVGPDGAVWVADWYNFIIQHNDFVEGQAPARLVLPNTPQPQKRGQGNAMVSELRDTNHGRIYRVVYKKAKPVAPIKLSVNDVPGLLAALENDNMFWRMHAQRLLVESKNKAALPGLYKIIANQRVDEIGLNSPAVHALWTLHGMGALDGSNAEALQVVSQALSHPAAGVRKAAVEVIPTNAQGEAAILGSTILKDKNLNTRKAAFLALTNFPASEQLGKQIYEASLVPENAQDDWLTKALLAAAITHETGFLAVADKNKSAATAAASNLTSRIVEAVSNEVYTLPRRGTLQFPPDVAGKEITVKGTISKGNRDLEGVIVAQGGQEAGYGLFIQNKKLQMVVKQNGKTYKATTTQPLPEKFDFVSRLANNGTMTITINDQQVAQGKAAGLFSQSLNQPLRAGEDLENENRMGEYEGAFRFAGNLQNATVALTRTTRSANNQTAKTTSAKASKNATKTAEPITINIKVVEHVMQFDKKLINIKAGQKVTLNLDNPDGMQHNLVIIKPGTLQKVGNAADALARDPNGASKDYVPQISEVLWATKLLNPEESFTLEFTAPTQPGDYIFVCTFPGHWRGMNGILRVTK